MGKKLLVLISSFALILFSSGLASAQPRDEEKSVGQEEVRQLGKNLAVNLVVEPADNKEGFTIVTAMEHFLVETEVEKGQERIGLEFEGKIHLKDSQLIIDERRLGGGKPILVNYRIEMHAVNRSIEGGFAFVLEGSALLDENEQVVIARSKDMVLRLKISSLE
ncbi:MAG: hypothetical protein PVG99_06730 [Desulfobacteraceae bacterium]|jgi:hypothetical protein